MEHIVQTGIKGEKLKQAPFKGIHFVGHSAANMKTQKEKAVLERKVQKFLNTGSTTVKFSMRACFFLSHFNSYNFCDRNRAK